METIETHWNNLIKHAEALLIKHGENRYCYIDPADLVTTAYLNLHSCAFDLGLFKKEILKEFYRQRANRTTDRKLFIDGTANDDKACPRCKQYFPELEFKPRMNRYGIKVRNGYCSTCINAYQRIWRQSESGRLCARRIRERYIATLDDNYVITLLCASSNFTITRQQFRERLEVVIKKKLNIQDKRLHKIEPPIAKMKAAKRQR